MKRHGLIFLIVLIVSYSSHAQQPTDCIDSVIVCGNSSINLDVSGAGTQELSGSNACASQENNSVWLQVNMATGGTLGFTLAPVSNAITEDYDFFVFGPNVPCNNIGQAIRCSTTNPQAAGQGNNLTGMNGSEVDTSEGPGPDGNSFVRWLDVNAGETYFIVIDRPIGNSGFNLTWTGSAQFDDPPVNGAGSGAALNLESCDLTAPFDDQATDFNLSSNTAQIIGTQTNIVVTYHATQSDAIIGTNALTSPYTNTSNPQTIYVRITNSFTGCFEVDTFQLDVNSGPNFTDPTDLEACDNDDDGDNTNGQIIFDLRSKDAEILNGQNPADIIISYYATLADANAGINPLPDLFYNTVPNLQQIFVIIEDAVNTNCRSNALFALVVNPVPEVFDTNLLQCDEDGTLDGLTLFNLNETNDVITGGNTNLDTAFYLSPADAQNEINEIDGTAFTNTNNPQSIYVRVTNSSTGCFNMAELTLGVSLTDINDAELVTCDDDGTEDGFYSFVLSDADATVLNGTPAGVTLEYYETYNDALLEQNPLSTTFTNTIPNSQIIYARAENANACYGISEITLRLDDLPDVQSLEEVSYCLNSFPQTITLTGGIVNDLPTNYTYSWSTNEVSPDIQVNAPGNYTVRVTNANGCFKDRTISVLASNIASITAIDIVDASSNNVITVVVSGEGDYEFALDDINGPYQDSNTFEEVQAGEHTVFVKDKNGCGIVNELVSVIGFPKFFTPNNDGFNDTWQIKGITFRPQPNSKILILDRYGKLLKQLDPQGQGWDGTFNGKQLHSDDYWFVITLEDGRVYKDHFALKR